MDIVRYSLVNWEQVSGEPPPSVAKATSGKGVYMRVKNQTCEIIRASL